jgi:deoxyribonuclease V
LQKSLTRDRRRRILVHSIANRHHPIDPFGTLKPDVGGLDPAEMGFFATLQNILSRREKRLPNKITRICGVDASYIGNRVAAVATEFKGRRMSEKSRYVGYCTFPYVSGLFYLHEGPAAVEAVRRLRTRPQLVCFDAHGAAHPRSAGLATVCGMVLGAPSIGIAKSLLVGTVIGEETPRRIKFRGRTVGFVTDVHGVPKYWSPGYSVSIRELESLIRGYGPVCLEAMTESHRDARNEIRSAGE